MSLRNAEFLNTEVPGCVVADDVLERMAAAGDAEGQRRAGMEIAVEMIQAVNDRVEGIQVSVPFGRVAIVEELLAGRPRMSRSAGAVPIRARRAPTRRPRSPRGGGAPRRARCGVR